MPELLGDWLTRLEQRTPESRIQLGLERVQTMLNRLPSARPRVPLITVGGTNGKGSVVAMLEAIYRAAGYRTLAYTSPHLLNFTERVRIDGRSVDEARMVEALTRVEGCRQELDLTYFEHITLAALWIAGQVAPDVVLLEVGLGGRLDAVNAVDPDVAVITSIGLDHMEWLGHSRRAIGREKAGIARPGRPLIVGETRPPAGWLEEIERRGVRLCAAGREFDWRCQEGRLILQASGHVTTLPRPALHGHYQGGNAAVACMAARALAESLPVTAADLAKGLRTVSLPGRLQKLSGPPEVWLDVGHNPDAASALAYALGGDPRPTTAVFSALAGKDVEGIAQALRTNFERWLVPELEVHRARPAAEVAAILRDLPVTGSVETVESVDRAVRHALETAESRARIVVFGSFQTVAEAWPVIPQQE